MIVDPKGRPLDPRSREQALMTEATHLLLGALHKSMPDCPLHIAMAALSIVTLRLGDLALQQCAENTDAQVKLIEMMARTIKGLEAGLFDLVPDSLRNRPGKGRGKKIEKKRKAQTH